MARQHFLYRLALFPNLCDVVKIDFNMSSVLRLLAWISNAFLAMCTISSISCPTWRFVHTPPDKETRKTTC